MGGKFFTGRGRGRDNYGRDDYYDRDDSYGRRRYDNRGNRDGQFDIVINNPLGLGNFLFFIYISLIIKILVLCLSSG